MGIDLVRGGGGRAHFLVAALSLLCIVLIFNWWSLSTENLDLLKQIGDLGDHLKSSSDLLEHCRRDRLSFENRVKTLEDDNDKLIGNLETEKRAKEDIKKDLQLQVRDMGAAEKERDDASNSLKLCRTELESLKKLDISKDGVIASMRVEKSGLSDQIQSLKDEITDLKQSLQQAKSVNTAAIAAPNKSSTTAAVPPKVGNAAGENEIKSNADADNIAEKGRRGEEKEEGPAEEDPREMEEMQENNREALEEKKDTVS